MTKKHDDIFDAVLSGVPVAREPSKKTEAAGGARFLRRGTAIAEKLSGDTEETVQHWVDPDRCRMWVGHNRNYQLLTEENCQDLIDGIRAQGRQEFPAIVRRLKDDDAFDYEVICGARRHFAVTALRRMNYTQFRFLVEPRELTDEEAFRLADIENRDRDDISDYERAQDYALAIDRYYGGRQRTMAERLEVSEVWLSRYLDLARLPTDIVLAFPSIRDIRERHARSLKPLLKAPKSRKAVLDEAAKIAQVQTEAREGKGAFLNPAQVLSRLSSAGKPPKRHAKATPKEYRAGGATLTHSSIARKHRLEFPRDMDRTSLVAAFEAFLEAEFGDLSNG